MEPFTIQQVKEDIYLITEPYFYEHANLYLIKGTKYDLLVDCGIGAADLREFLLARGFRPRVLLTHAHFDHAGGLRHFKPEEILATRSVLGNLRDRGHWGLEYLTPEEFDGKTFTTLTGRTPEEFCSTFSMLLPEGVAPLSLSQLAIGDYRFDLIPVPGHTDDSLMIFDRASALLVSGDTLYDGKLYADLPNSDIPAFMRALRLIQKLAPARTLPGHNQLLDRAATVRVITKWLDALSREHKK